MSTDLAAREEATRPSFKADSLADTVLILLTLTVVQRLVGFARSVLFCRWLEPEELGEWDMAWGFLLLAAPVAVLGLPGSFGRYVEHYRQRGNLRSFLRQAGLFIASLTLLAVAIVGSGSVWFSHLIFGRGDCVELVRLLAASLALVIAYNGLSDLFTSLRLSRVVSFLQFLHSVLFALFSVGLMLLWRSTVASVISAYALACLVCVLAGIVWLRRTWHSLPPIASPLTSSALLAKIMPFAIWVWVTNWLFNLFDIVARYMIVHHSGLSAAEALVQVGNYHSARVVPLLLVTIAGLLGTAALPHLSHDWERGDRQAVSRRVNLMLKLIAFGLMVGGAMILLAAPVLFDTAYGGKYAPGRAVLPYALASCVWFGLIGIAQNYLWCAEKARLGSLPILAGVLLNIGLNLVLLPWFGLTGAVCAAAATNLSALALTYVFSVRSGLKFDPGVWIVLAMPPLFCAGPWIMLAALTGLTAWAIQRDYLLSTEEKGQLRSVASRYVARLRPLKTAPNA